MSEADEWTPVQQQAPAQDDEWQPVTPSDKPFDPIAGEYPQAAIPEAFMDRVRAGQALSRITQAAIKEGGEALGTGTPTGFSDETLNHLISLGVFHDPASGRPGPIQMANEAIMMPTAKLWEGIQRATAAGIGGAGGAFGQLVSEFGGSQGTAERAKNEVINLGNWAMIEAGMGRFSRPSVEGGAVIDRQVGGLPTPQDFTNAARVLAPDEKVQPPAPGMIRFYHGTAYEDASGFTGKTFVTPYENYARDYHGGPNNVLYADLTKDEAIASGLWDEINERPINGSMENGSERLRPLESGATEANLRRIEPTRALVPALSEEQRVAIQGQKPAPADFKTKEDYFAAKDKWIAAGGSEDLSSGIKRDLSDANELLKQHGVQEHTGYGYNVRWKKWEDELWLYRQEDGGESLLLSDVLKKSQSEVREALQKGVKRAGVDADLMDHFYSTDVPSVEDAARDIAKQNLRRMWQEDGIHPAEAVHDAQGDAFLKHEITAPHEEIKPDPETEKVLEETGGAPGSLSAAVTPPDEVPLDVQPAAPAGTWSAAAKAAADKLFDVGRDIQMKLTPMARGSVDSMATVKDYMNAMRKNAWDASRTDTDLTKQFSAQERARLANAMEEESLSLRLEEPASGREHQGLATLTPEERAVVEDLNQRQQQEWLRARDLGMVEGDGIAMHYPRMVVGIPKGLDKSAEGSMSLTAIGYDLRSRTPYLKQRKHMELEETEKAVKDKIGMQLAKQGKSVDEINAALDKVKVVRDIRAVNLATKQLQDAIAGRTVINNIKEVGKRTGEDAVAEGFDPGGWFTMDHPAFKTWRPKMGEDAEGNISPVKDGNGNIVFEQVPIYVRSDFEGPLRAAMWGDTGAAYSGMMAIKGKTMGLIMNSPMIHNLVEFGRAFPAMPTRIFKAYFDGYRAKNDPAVMHEAIDAGLVPIGKRFFNQDINAIMEAPDLTPGRSWTAKVAAAIPGLFDEAAGTAVKQAIDKAGDFWHNTLLWDRVADLQMGLYTNFRGDLVNKGMDAQTASRIAAHFANRYAGALPKEAMSEMATKVSNFMFFSRSFTFGNLGVMKDMLTGLPKDVMAQIERDAGFGRNVYVGYHGTHQVFDKFSDEKMGTGVGASDTAGLGHFFATDPAVASGYAEGTAGAGNVRRVQLNFKNPKLIEKHGINDLAAQDEELAGIIKNAMDEGHDGLVLKNVGKKGSDIVVSFSDDTIENLAYGKTPDLSSIKKDIVGWSKLMARRKAIATVALDVALMWAGNTVLQSAFSVMLGGRTLNEEEHEYIRRARDVINDTAVHPLSLLNPFNIASIPGRLSSTYDNEPGKQNRILIGYAKDGTAIYARNPVGKIGDEFAGYFDSPLDMMRKKEGTILRPLMQIYSNDAGFRRSIYDPHAETLSERAAAIGAMVKHLMASQLPVGQISAFSDLVKGEGDKFVNELQAFGPFAGVTFSKGAPGGPAVGEMYDNKSRFEFAVSQAMPDLRRQIQRGDKLGAEKIMTELGMDANYQKWVEKTSLDPRLRLSPRSVRDFYNSATQEQQARFKRAKEAAGTP